MGKIDVAAASDGSRFAWVAYSVKQAEIRMRETGSGREESVPLSNRTLSVVPRLNRDGSRLTYSDITDGKLVASVRDIGTARTWVLCEDCFVLDSFSKASGFLVQSGSRLVRQEVGGGQQYPILDAAGHGRLFEAALTPSDASVAFTLALPNGTAALFVASVTQPASAATWIKLAEVRNFIGALSWSNDGRLLYYASTRDGFICIWAQRFAAEGKPQGEPFAAFHNHTAPNMMFYGAARTRASRDRLYMLLADFKGDLWSLTLLR